MRSLPFLSAASLSLISAGLGFASPGAAIRDIIKKEDSAAHEKMWALLEVKPLPKVPGNPILRIWDERGSVTFSTSKAAVTIRVVQGDGDVWFSYINSGIHEPFVRPPNALALLKTKATEFTYPDEAFADDIRYLISQYPLFDSASRGADGWTTFFDVRDADGKFSTFEVWSPDDTKAPIPAEICEIFQVIRFLVTTVTCTDAEWKRFQKSNFTTRFPELTGINLNREKARTYLDEVFKRRLQNFVSELRRR